MYECEAKCHKQIAYVAPSAEDYAKFGNAELLEEYDACAVDYSRYGHPPLDPNSKLAEYHRPTCSEAARRGILMKAEILKRMER